MFGRPWAAFYRLICRHGRPNRPRRGHDKLLAAKELASRLSIGTIGILPSHLPPRQAKSPPPALQQTACGQGTCAKVEYWDHTGFPALTLKDKQGGIVSVLVDESLNMRNLKVGPPEKPPVTKHESQFIVGLFAPTTRPGAYDLFISVGTRDGTPTIALPLTGGDGQRRYRIGSIALDN